MNIQYCHVRKYSTNFFNYKQELNAKGGQTIAAQELAPWFIEPLQIGDFFTKLIGKAKCSDEENYNKKTGRELSSSRMKQTVLTVVSNQDFGGFRELILKDDSGNLYYFEKRINKNKVYFVGYDKE